MNILMMTNTYTPILGGLEKSIQSFVREFRERGHKVVIATPEFEGMPKREVQVVRLPSIQHFNGTDFSVNLPIPGLLSKFMESFHPDLIHSHHPFLVGDMALRMCGQYQLPLIFTYHTMFEQYTHYLPVDNEASKRFIVELACGYANMADQVIAPSESVRDLLLERGVKTPIAVIPTGVDVRRFRQSSTPATKRKFKIPPKSFVVGHIGRLAPEKNLDFMAAAVAQFLAQKKDAHFLLAGKGPSEKQVKAIFKKAGVANRLHMVGALEGKHLIHAYHAMDVFAFASKSETQGMVVTEAMAAGVPVVAIDAPGVREVVRDRRNGRLLPTESIGSFVRALLWMTNLKRVDQKKMKNAALKTAESFSIETCASKALKVYASVIKRNRKSFPKQLEGWDSLLGRIKTEFEMMMNIGKAAGAAISEAAMSTSDLTPTPSAKSTQPLKASDLAVAEAETPNK